MQLKWPLVRVDRIGDHRSNFIPQKPRNLSSPLFELWKREYKIISYENVHNYDFSGVFSFNTFIIDLSCWLAVFLSFAFGKSIDVLSISITSTPRSDIYAICHLIIWHIQEILPESSGGGICVVLFATFYLGVQSQCYKKLGGWPRKWCVLSMCIISTSMENINSFVA